MYHILKKTCLSDTLRCGVESKTIFECRLCACCRALGERHRGQQHRRTPAERRTESSAARITERDQELRPSSATEVSGDFITQAKSDKNHQPLG